MTKVRRLDENGDWTFGQGFANYAQLDERIRQNIVTRLKSFRNDWVLDFNAGINWFDILSQKDNQELIYLNIFNTVLNTEDVLRIDDINIQSITNRNATIQIQYTSIFEESNNVTVTIDANS
jgi:hypothetical protein